MKTCPECGGSFKNLGAHMRRHKGKGNAMREGVQKEADAQEDTKPERPLDRFRNRRVIVGNGGAVIMRR